MKNLTILGSTGSVGINTLKIVKNNLDKICVRALVANRNVSLMTKQCIIFRPNYACMIDDESSILLKNNLSYTNLSTIVLSGNKSACELASLDNVDIVMSAIVGFAGLSATIAALKTGKKVLLANKESLISCGRIFMNEVHNNGALLIPVDSEHNAIFQSLPKSIQLKLGNISLKEYGISKIILTASGGPFFKKSLIKMSKITPEQACKHPTWFMGKKISVDSATMMNKGLEYIEAQLLFNAKPKQIEILLHPQSIIHSMIEYIDGSLFAQLGNTDIRIPISNAMFYPKRIHSGSKLLNFLNIKKLTFEELDLSNYPCLQLAMYANKNGQAAITTLNAANEIAVEAFLQKKIKFTDIALINQQVLEQKDQFEPKNIEDIFYIDNKARNIARCKIKYYEK